MTPRRRDSGAIEIDLDYHAQRRAEFAAKAESPALFDHTEAATPGAVDTSPIEHEGQLPQAVAREERPPTLVISCETEEERAALVEALGVSPQRRERSEWVYSWPPDADDGELRLDLG
jgi:hypothetical protein